MGSIQDSELKVIKGKPIRRDENPLKYCENCMSKNCETCVDDELIGKTNYLSQPIKERCSDCICMVDAIDSAGQWFCDEEQIPCMQVENCQEQILL
jgi:hypothetical protein